MNGSRLWLLVAGFLVVVVLGVRVYDGGAHRTAAKRYPPVTEEVTGWSHGRDGAMANAEEHWRKHGDEFPEFRNEQDYERAANNFVHHPPAGTLTKHRANGDTLFYDPQSNTFAVEDGEGEPRTFFRPDSGRRYWDRQ